MIRHFLGDIFLSPLVFYNFVQLWSQNYSLDFSSIDDKVEPSKDSYKI